jgi:hypothetical protein
MFSRHAGGLRVRSLSASHRRRIQAHKEKLIDKAPRDQRVNVRRVLVVLDNCLLNGQFTRQQLKQLGKWGHTRMRVEYYARNLLWVIFAIPDASTHSCTWAIPPRVIDHRNRLLRSGEAELELWMEKVEYYWNRHAAKRVTRQAGNEATNPQLGELVSTVPDTPPHTES